MFPCPLASGDVPDRGQQEGHQQQPASPHPGRHPQNRLVHVSPHPRGDARQRLAALGGGGKVVEVDETFIGHARASQKGRAAWANKNVVLTLVERGGSARSFHVDGVRIHDIATDRARKHSAAKPQLMTDEGGTTITSAKSWPAMKPCTTAEDEYVREATV